MVTSTNGRGSESGAAALNPLLNRIKRRATDPTPSMKDRANDQRGGLRKPSDLPGFIWSEKLPAALPCSIRDLSATGALLQLKPSKDAPDNAELPGRFVLVLTQYRERTEVDCALVRQGRDGLGVRFTGQFRTSQANYRIAAGAGRRR